MASSCNVEPYCSLKNHLTTCFQSASTARVLFNPPNNSVRVWWGHCYPQLPKGWPGSHIKVVRELESSTQFICLSTKPGVASLWDLVPDNLRCSWYSNNRNKVHNNLNLNSIIRIFSKPSSHPIHGKTVFHRASLVAWIFQARIVEWVAIPFCRESFQPRDRTQVSCTADRLFTIWVTVDSNEDPTQPKIKINT